jgi:hypothetical protein
MAILLTSYHEIAELINHSGKLPKQIKSVSAEDGAIKITIKLLIETSVKVFVESCEFPTLRLKYKSAIPGIIIQMAKLFFPKKIPENIKIEMSTIEINLLYFLTKKGYSADQILMENVDEGLKIEVQNFRKISVDK